MMNSPGEKTDRRTFLRKCAGLGLGGFAVSTFPLIPSSGSGKPNVIVIMCDDQGYECLSCYGSASYQTPVLDTLAATGARFTHAYSQPLCTPSRTQIMTGRYNFRNYTQFGVFDFTETTFAHVMKSAGYATCISGKWQLIGRGVNGPYDAGFDEYCLWHMTDVISNKGSRYRDPVIIQNGTLLENTQGLYGSDVFTGYINDFIERHQSEPFFVYYPMALTHSPFQPTPDNPEWGQDITDKKFYKDMVEYMDKTIGRIVQKLDNLGLRDNTLILFTGDNGTPRGITSQMQDGSSIAGGKSYTTDAGTHVALIANWPGTIPAGQVRDDLVDFSDILPTVAEAGGASYPMPRPLDGRSFLPQLRGEIGNPREWIFCHYQKNPENVIQRFVRDQRWKLYDAGSYDRAGNLYDVPNDFLEEHPVAAGDPEADAARIRLQTELDAMPWEEDRTAARAIWQKYDR